MKIAAIYENDKIRPIQFVQFKKNIVNLTIVVPDEEVESMPVGNFDSLDNVKDESIKQMIVSMRNIRGIKTKAINHELTDNELFAEGLKESGKYGV